MKKDKIKVYFIELVLVSILAFALFVPNFNRVVLALGLTVVAVVISVLLRKREIPSINKKTVIIIVTILAIIYLVGFYLMGLYFGYYRATVQFGKWTIANYIFPIALIIVSSEIIRNILLAQNTKSTKIVTFIAMLLVDLIVYVNVYAMDEFKAFIEIVGFTLFSSISCNLMYNYISKRYTSVPVIIYRLITVLYVYFIPYIPNVFLFFRCVLRTIYPYFVYLLLEYTFPSLKKVVAYKDRTREIITRIIVCLILALIVMLISCQFKYGILVIGSGSMTGTIDKGDAIIYERYDGQKVTKGEIIIFNQDDIQVVHRVMEVKKVNDVERYVTKGDANIEFDEGFITEKDIFGTYKFKIKYIGYPSLWLRDIFSK